MLIPIDQVIWWDLLSGFIFRYHLLIKLCIWDSSLHYLYLSHSVVVVRRFIHKRIVQVKGQFLNNAKVLDPSSQRYVWQTYELNEFLNHNFIFNILTNYQKMNPMLILKKNACVNWSKLTTTKEVKQLNLHEKCFCEYFLWMRLSSLMLKGM